MSPSKSHYKTENQSNYAVSLLRAAEHYHAKGWVTVPMAFRDKKPLIKGHSTRTLEDVKLDQDFTNQPTNIAIAMGEASGGLVDIDFDCDEAKVAAEFLMPVTSMMFGHSNNPKSHFIYQVDDCGKTAKFQGPSGMILEYRSNGNLTVFPPSTHKSGVPIEFITANDATPATISREALLKACSKTAAAALIAQNWQEGKRHHIALDLSALLCRAGWGEEEAELFMTAICEAADDEEPEDRLLCITDSYAKVVVDSVTTGLPSLEQKLGADVTKKVVEWLCLNNLKPAPKDHPSKSIRLNLPKGVEMGEDLAAAHLFKNFAEHDAVYCKERKSWYVWDGARWCPDTLDKTHLLAYESASKLFLEGVKQNNSDLRQWGQKLQSSRNIKNMLEISRDLMAISASKFDQNPDLLTCENGTIDLKTGTRIDHDPAHHITQLVPVEFNANATCPRFLKFLDEIFDGDHELIAYIQRLVGYSLTGHTKEQGFFIFYGTGRNGKSTLTSLAQHIAGDLASVLNPETLLKSKNDNLNDIAELQGKRLIMAQEIDAGRKLNEGLIKQLTGGDMIVGRQKYEKNVKFIPQCKIWLSVNHRPEIKGDDTGIWRRVNLIPFTVSIREEDVDKDLLQKLQDEKEGIFNWAIEGSKDWYDNGLNAPKAVIDANAEYRSDMDTVGRFIEACCEANAHSFTEFAELHDGYKAWCDVEGVEAVNRNEFGRKLGIRGFESEIKSIRSEKKRIRKGIKLVTNYAPQF